MDFIVIGGGCYGTYHSGQLLKAMQKGKLPADTRLIIVDRNPARAALGDRPGCVFVQSDWLTYLLDYFDPKQGSVERYESVQIVPAPFAPHLMFDWLLRAVNAVLMPRGVVASKSAFAETLALPYEYSDPKEGNHFMSRAGWRCPSACIEPAKCPAVRGVRDWDLQRDLVSAIVEGRRIVPSVSAAPALVSAGLPNGGASVASTISYTDAITFTCHHYVHGIGTTPATQLYAARARVLAAAGAHFATPGASPLRFGVGTASHCHGVVATLTLHTSDSFLTMEGEHKEALV